MEKDNNNEIKDLIEELKKSSQNQQQDSGRYAIGFTAITLLFPILVSVLLGLFVAAPTAWLFFGMFNFGMAVYVTTSTLVNVFMMKSTTTSKYAFWMLYFILAASFGLSLGIAL